MLWQAWAAPLRRLLIVYEPGKGTSTIKRDNRRILVNVGVSKGTELEDRKAGAEPGAGTADEARCQAITGQSCEFGMSGTNSSVALFGEHIVFEDLILIRSPPLHGRISFRLRVWGPPHKPGRGDSRLDCLRKAKYPIRSAAIGMSKGEPRVERYWTMALNDSGFRGGDWHVWCVEILSPPLQIRLIPGSLSAAELPLCSSTQLLAPDSAFLTAPGDFRERYRYAVYWRAS